MYKHLSNLIISLVFLLCTNNLAAQVTTASMTGKVVMQKEDIIGALVEALHEPSGTSYKAITNSTGRFSIQGMRTGGPYKVTVSYIGCQTAMYTDIYLQLGEEYNLNVELEEKVNDLSEVVVVARASRFSNEKTGATTNITSKQIREIPTVNRSISDIARLSPYASGMSFAGGDGRSTNFTVDGANFNNNFGLSSNLPGGGNPISMDAIEEVQVVIAPFDVRQTNFIGGGINAITRSGTNTFKGSAYTYQYSQNMRGNRIDGESLGDRQKDAKHIYGATFGGPIIKNKLFFFGNVEYEKVPEQLTQWRARGDNETPNPDGYISETKLSDMQNVSQFLQTKYGYNTGSATSFPADQTNWKFLGRIDWNVTNDHKLSFRYNHTKNEQWNPTNGNSSDTGYRLRNMDRISKYSMAFANSMYSMENKVSSFSLDLNSRFGDKISNKLLVTYSHIEDKRGTDSSVFPFIDIMAGYGTNGNQILQPYMSAGYELFTYNNGVDNKVWNVTENMFFNLGAHKLTAGLSFEHQMANNAYMRNGTGYYRYGSVDDLLNGAAPESFALTYGYGGTSKPVAEVSFNQFGLYLQDEWNVSNPFKLTYGLRLDNISYSDKDLVRNNAIYDLSFGNRPKIDTGQWPSSKIQFSPRAGFTWDVLENKSLKVRGGTGLFSGRLPLVFFTNMPTNSGMVQNLVQISTTYNSDGTVKSRDPRLDLLKGGMVTDVNEMIKVLGLPNTITEDQGVVPSNIASIDRDFKMPQVWKSSIALDYQIPTSFPFYVTTEFMYTKNINAVRLVDYNIKEDNSQWERFAGADNRLIYPKDYTYYATKQVANAAVLTNTSKGYGWTANVTLNAKPLENLDLMLAYTHTESKEVSGMPGSNASSAWSGLYTINGPNFADVQRSQYVVPDKIIGSASYSLPYKAGSLTNKLTLSLFYSGYSPYGNSFTYINDMNGDGIAGDLMYIPKDDSEIIFKDEADRAPFWAFVNQDSYLKNHKGEYAEAYAARAPWVHRFDLRIAHDFSIRAGKSINTLQLSLDFMNIGNLLKSTWGVTKTNIESNSGRILKYEGMNSEQKPIYSLYRNSDKVAPTKTYSFNKNYNETWKFQVGVRYMFN